jgi:glycosyltransferase involved in cell wall biosynthesis
LIFTGIFSGLALEQKISDFGLGGRFILEGIKENPYPYVQLADVYVQPSRFEGKSIAIDEAKILAKPIVVTNFPSVVDQIAHCKNGYITAFDALAIADGIAELITNAGLREIITGNLRDENLGTEAEIAKMHAAISH